LSVEALIDVINEIIIAHSYFLATFIVTREGTQKFFLGGCNFEKSANKGEFQGPFEMF